MAERLRGRPRGRVAVVVGRVRQIGSTEIIAYRFETAADGSGSEWRVGSGEAGMGNLPACSRRPALARRESFVLQPRIRAVGEIQSRVLAEPLARRLVVRQGGGDFVAEAA